MIIVAAILAIFVYGVIAAMLGTILPDLSRRFKLTPEQNGAIAFAQALGLIIASVGVGPLIDNQGKKPGLVLGLGLIGVALFLLPRAKSYGQIKTWMFLLGLGGGILVTGANALVSDVNEAQRASTLNLLNLFFGLGGLATPFISANLLKNDSFRLCNLAAILSIITLAVNFAAPIPPPSGTRGFEFSQAGGLLGNSVLWLLAAFLFLYVAAEVGVWNWLARHLIAQGIDDKTALNVLSLGFALGLLIGRVVVSRILTTVPAAEVTMASAVLIALTTFLMLRARSTTMAWVTVFAAGIAMAPVFPTTLAIVGDRFTQSTATAMGLVITCGWIGLAVSSRIIGAIAGADPRKLKTALLLLPAAGVLMVLINLGFL